MLLWGFNVVSHKTLFFFVIFTLGDVFESRFLSRSAVLHQFSEFLILKNHTSITFMSAIPTSLPLTINFQ